MTNNGKTKGRTRYKGSSIPSQSDSTPISENTLLADTIHIKNFKWNSNEDIEFPVSYLDPSIIKLTNSPLDDYQRSFFNYTLLNDKDLDLNIEYTTYRTSIAEQFTSPIYQSKQKHSKRHGRNAGGHRRSKHLLECFEYQLPNLRQSFNKDNTDEQDFTNLESTEKVMQTYRENLCLGKSDTFILDGFIIDPTDDDKRSENEKERNDSNGDTKNNVIPDNGGDKVPIKRDSDANLENLIHPDASAKDTTLENISYSLTKNQKFRLQKMDHNSEKNQKIINPNNCIIWTFEGGYVFLTGIWRLYQDVMKGLITIPRKNCNNDSNLQELCAEEFKKVLSHTIFNLASENDSKPQQSKKRQYPNSTSMKSTDSKNSESSKESSATSSDILDEFNKLFSQSKSKYTDLHWNSLPSSLRQELFESFKKHLIKEKNVPSIFFNGFDMTQLIHRIRGGYIKIQGTWIPMEIAKALCIKFCFPIRYFLVPIFGADFPDHCAAWFLENQENYDNALDSNSSPEAVYNPITKKTRSGHKLNSGIFTDTEPLSNTNSTQSERVATDESLVRLNNRDVPQQAFSIIAKEYDGKYIQHPVATPQYPQFYPGVPGSQNRDISREIQNKPYLPHINSLINSLHGETPKNNEPSEAPFQSPYLQHPQNTVNIHPGNNIPMNQTFLDGARGVSQPVYAMSAQYDNVASPVYPSTIQYPLPLAYDPYNKRNNIDQMGRQIISIPTPTNHQGLPIINQHQTVYIPHQIVQGPSGGQVPTPNQMVYINEGHHIIPQQIMPDNVHQPGQLAANPSLSVQYSTMEDNRMLPTNNNGTPMAIQRQMQSYIPPQYINNAVMVSQGNKNRNVQYAGPYVIQRPNGEKEQYYHPGQLPPTGQQNPYWQDGRYQ
ncbi:similar to Saccharomyces cerevisiae YIL101C XBP1 Transcriptional repressor that binds to promoter sequences of the cyclin genes, CYS3, and SMF2 [Maudiozyma saulgeensis]|uniref:Similar to Saccharomyces cerevisiae YIL101C XBP1 Transcriptional repressor that binds to promoter sequences of the cyclin genes, CYS3, and SMF2 n=1 Tax=Maudiozyma saulgeensis TaxID=1789683 RepID=A0A1X7R4I4_9SACH|nr:similar to Saccharomyces cerevisiae YIL101C XBP1 Transcriptional repressor that binds to promoter sequences of the cyclin genes, CYS3, and SMF2 [Kazachstania saulgeensis]